MEGGIRVPFAAQWPGHIPKGLVYQNPVISLDIFATITALAKAPLEPGRPLDGVNLMPYLTGTNPGAPHDAIFLRMCDKGAYAGRLASLPREASLQDARIPRNPGLALRAGL